VLKSPEIWKLHDGVEGRGERDPWKLWKASRAIWVVPPLDIVAVLGWSFRVAGNEQMPPSHNAPKLVNNPGGAS
jgi:hypothetical protein